MLTDHNLHSVDEPEIGYGQLLNILLRRFIWFGGAIAGAVGIAFFLTSREDPTYQSSMQLLVEPNYRQTVDITGSDNTQPSRSQADYATQLNLMRSNSFTEQAVAQLLDTHPTVCDAVETSADCSERFQSTLSLSQVIENKTETRIFEAIVKGANPEITQAFLEALGDVYLNYNLGQQEQRIERGLALVNQQIEEVQTTLTASRQELKRFREAENLINPEQQALSVAVSLRELEQLQIDIDTQYDDVRARYTALQEQVQDDPQTALISSRLSQSSRYQRLLNSLQEIELDLEKRLALYAEADPGVQDLVSQRQGQVSLLQEEVTRVLGEVPAHINLNETALLTEGQMGQIDLDLVSDLVKTQVQLRSLEARQTGLAEAKRGLESQLNEFPQLIAEYDRIQPEVEIQQQSLEQLLTLRQELSNELAQGGFSWDIVEAAQLGEQISPNPKRNLLLGAIAGMFVGGALAFGREALDKVVRTSDELQKQTTLPLLGVIPDIPTRELDSLLTPLASDHQPTEVSSQNRWQPFRDAVDLIYKTIQLKGGQPLSSLMITSALAGEGKTTLAVGLAISAARSHKRVLLMDTNLRQPSLHHRLGLPLDQGLSAHLQAHQLPLGQAHLTPTTISLAGTAIDVLTAGPIPSDPVQLLSSLRMQHLLAYAEANYDLVIVDAPAILGSAEGLQLASMCKGVVMVNRLDQVTQADLTEAIAALKQVNPIGIVANSHRGGIRPSKPHHGASGKLSTGGTSTVWNMVQSAQSLLKRDRPSTTTPVTAPALLSESGNTTVAPSSNTMSIDEAPTLPPKNSRNPLSPSQEMGQHLRNMAQSYMQLGVMSMHVPQWSESP